MTGGLERGSATNPGGSTPGTKPLIYLADLTHTGHVIAQNVTPLGVGLIAAYLLEVSPDTYDVQLFKYPTDFSRALADRMPRVIGFANYTWNCDLIYEYTMRIKRRSPETVVVLGGPNYGLRPAEMAEFWRRYPLVDFHIIREGEQAFAEFIKTLATFDYNAQALKETRVKPPNCHYLHEGELIMGELLPRLELAALPSPYLAGLMDQFFDGVLVPLIHTTRGCPFTCTFCTEGATYYNKVKQRVDLWSELVYIAERVGHVKDVHLSDANFGMYREDADKARMLAQVRERYGWPERVYVSTGKNQQARVLEVASILRGALNVGASLQSTDEGVLANIERKNISIEALTEVARQGNSDDTMTYTELILALPGDTLEKHTKSLRDAVTAGLGIVRSYQLLMIPQTELNTPETRAKYGMRMKYRITQRSLGRYEVFGESFCSVEPEEICVETDTLTFEEYLDCRELDLTVEVMHNHHIFSDLAALCRRFELSWFDFLLAFHAKRRSYSPSIARFYDGFRQDINRGLWESRDQLEADVKRHMDRYLADGMGINELTSRKAIATFQLMEELYEFLFREMRQVLSGKGHLIPIVEQYLEEAKRFSQLRKQQLLEPSLQYEGTFHFDFKSLMREGAVHDPVAAWFEQPIHYRFRHSEEQAVIIRSYVEQYGTSNEGLGRILMRAPLKKMFRQVETVEKDALVEAR